LSGAHLPGLAFLDTLRPSAGWRVDRALLSTYSADPAVLAAVLLALAARDDDGGTGTKVGLARALIELRDRVAFVLQRGRLAAPRTGAYALGLLDRFVREVPWNEGREDDVAGRSWHPKFAIIRLVPDDDGSARWRIWLGSRNLTRDLSWDIGLSIEGQPKGSGQPVQGVVEAVRRLAEAAGEANTWKGLLAEVETVRWDVPRGLRVNNIHLHLPGDEHRDFPAQPPGVSALFAASPFLDGAGAAKLGAWGTAGTQRTLVSTKTALAGIAGQQSRPLQAYTDLLALPSTPADMAPAVTEEDVEEEVDGRGLHAKFIWADHSGGTTLWLGSANLTRRGWTRNAEAVAEIAVERRGNARAAMLLCEGIEAFRNLGETILLGDLAAVPVEDPEKERLEQAHREVAARFDARQHQMADNAVRVVCATSPCPDDPDVTLSVGRLVGPATLWGRSDTSIVLPSSGEAALGDLLVLSLRLGDRALAWTQAAPFDPPLGARRDARDAAALAAWLGARGIMATIRDLLSGAVEGDGGGPWDSPREPAQFASRRGTAAADAPTIEQVLRTWQRDPMRLALVDRMLKVPLPHITSDPLELDANRRLAAFRRSWKVMRPALEGVGNAD